ncbi:hypothetical protein ACSIGC_13595 [Tenacibaculum sp. ZS6-P6]|uniref:hypothetical protein n=1 Tax=Tenacibaculum sp. ZS6-P6 TaxID=3447503 RepID=UPI003F9ACF2F
MKSKSVLFLLLFSIVKLSAQNKNIDSVYVKYFQYEREIPYLHLNKISFAVGEEVWFKAYVLNTNTQKLHPYTTNLHCTIYDDQGVFKKTDLIYIKDGVGNGSFKIDSTFTGKSYYIKASTNYMKNFEENQSFVQKITIVDGKEETVKPVNKEKEYDLQILPEGGHLLANTTNSLGIILKDATGNPIGFKKGELVDQFGKVIKEFVLNQFGMVKVSVFISQKDQLKVRVKRSESQIIETFLPPKELQGVSLAFENISSNMVKVIVKTNPETIKNLQGKKYYVLIHNTNAFLKREIEFKPELLTYSLYLNKKLFKAGTNIVTLFTDADKPIGERVFFNYQKSLFDAVEVEFKQKKDSVSLIIGKEELSNEYRLSVSILPAQTKAYKPSQNIYSKFLIQPYIKGNINDGAYFFKDITRKKLWELDLLLLTQGWSKYNWYDVFNNPPIERFPFETGIHVKGTLNVSGLGKSVDVYIRSDQNKLFVNEKTVNNKFEFKNLKLKNNSSIFISYTNKKGEFISPNLYVSSYPDFDKSNIKLPLKKEQEVGRTKEVQKIFLTETEEVLDEVEVKGKIKFNHTPLIGDRTRGYKVSEDYSVHQNLLSFLRNQGLEVRSTLETLEIRRIRQSAFNFRPNQREILVSKTRVFLDNQEITRDNHRLLNLKFTKLGEYEEIFITDVFDLQIYLYSKDKAEFIDNSNGFYEYKIPLGFHVSKEYYHPKYLSTTSDTFKSYGAIYWEPNVNLDENNKKQIFTFPSLKQNEITVFLEGITKEGKLIAIEKLIKIQKY